MPVAILDAGRNALSFFLLLVVSLGLSVVRESLGKLMIRCQVLAVAHFIFGGTLSFILIAVPLTVVQYFTLSVKYMLMGLL